MLRQRLGEAVGRSGVLGLSLRFSGILRHCRQSEPGQGVTGTTRLIRLGVCLPAQKATSGGFVFVFSTAEAVRAESSARRPLVTARLLQA